MTSPVALLGAVGPSELGFSLAHVPARQGTLHIACPFPGLSACKLQTRASGPGAGTLKSLVILSRSQARATDTAASSGDRLGDSPRATVRPALGSGQTSRWESALNKNRSPREKREGSAWSRQGLGGRGGGRGRAKQGEGVGFQAWNPSAEQEEKEAVRAEGTEGTPRSLGLSSLRGTWLYHRRSSSSCKDRTFQLLHRQWGREDRGGRWGGLGGISQSPRVGRSRETEQDARGGQGHADVPCTACGASLTAGTRTSGEHVCKRVLWSCVAGGWPCGFHK